jgi:hypothetical protein
MEGHLADLFLEIFSKMYQFIPWAISSILVIVIGFYFFLTDKSDIVDASQLQIIKLTVILVMVIWVLVFGISNILLMSWGIREQWNVLEWVIFSFYIFPFIALFFIYLSLPIRYHYYYRPLQSKKADSPFTEDEIRKCCNQLTIHFPKIIYSEKLKNPEIYEDFFIKPTLALPLKFPFLDGWKFILLHELAHIKNNDVAFISTAKVLFDSFRYWIPFLLFHFSLCHIFVNSIDKMLFFTTALSPLFILFLFLFKIIYLWTLRYRELIADARASLLLNQSEFDKLNSDYFKNILSALEIRKELRSVSRDEFQRNLILKRKIKSYISKIKDWKIINNLLNKFIIIKENTLSTKNGLLKFITLLTNLPESKIVNPIFSFFGTHPNIEYRIETFKNQRYIYRKNSLPSFEIAIFTGLLIGIIVNIIYTWLPLSPLLIKTIASNINIRYLTTCLLLFLPIIIGIVFTLPIRNTMNHPDNYGKYTLAMILKYIVAGISTYILCYLWITFHSLTLGFEIDTNPISLSLGKNKTDEYVQLHNSIWGIYIFSFCITIIFALSSIRKISLEDIAEFEDPLQGVISMCFGIVSNIFFSFYCIAQLFQSVHLGTLLLSIYVGHLVRLKFSHLIDARYSTRIFTISFLKLILKVNLTKFNTPYRAKISYLLSLLYCPFQVFILFSLPIIVSYHLIYQLMENSSKITELVIVMSGIVIWFIVMKNLDSKNDKKSLYVYLISNYFRSLVIHEFGLENSVKAPLKRIYDLFNNQRRENVLLLEMDIVHGLVVSNPFDIQSTKTSIAEWVISCENKKGGFSIAPGTIPDMKSTYQAIDILHQLNMLYIVDISKHTHQFMNYQTINYSFESIYYAVASLHMLNTEISNSERCANWMLEFWREKPQRKTFINTYYLTDALSKMGHLEKIKDELLQWQASQEMIIKNLRIDTNYKKIYYYTKILDILDKREESEAIRRIRLHLETEERRFS